MADGHGGPRQGAPGATYTNRTDLNQNRQPIRSAPGQQYGQRTAQEDAQRQIPLPSVMRPTERPTEPITAGLPFGPGPGPSAATMPQSTGTSSAIATIRAAYMANPTEDLRALLEYFDEIDGQ